VKGAHGSGPSAEGSKGMGFEEEAVPLPENFCISYIKMVSFCAFPEIFIDTCNCKTLRGKINPRMF